MAPPSARDREDDGSLPADIEQPAAELLAPVHQGHIRQANAWSVLSAVRSAGVTSRSRVTRETGLTGMTVHRLMTDLRHRKLVVSGGRPTRGSVGRPPSLFRFNASIGCVAGIDVGNETTRFVLADLDGRALAQAVRLTADLEADLAHILASAVTDLQLAAGVRRESLVGVGVGVPAVVDGAGTIVRASQHHAWEDLALGSYLRETLGSEVIVTQDDHLAALAELRRGACIGLRNAVVLDVGKGIGVGIIADGVVHAGAHAAAGRVAWIPLPMDALSPGEASSLGSRLTGDGLVAAYRDRGGRDAVTGAADVFATDLAGDQAAGLVIDEFAARLGWVIGALVAVIDPELVVIGGGVSRSFERLRPGVERRLAEIVPVPPPVVASNLVPDAVVLGAIDAARELADNWLKERIGV
jgi:predicted NBD/HSP70 family sugar kinase